MRIALLILALLPCQTAALSCMQPDPVRDYKAAEASADVWIAVEGQLSFDQGALPLGGVATTQRTPPQTDIPARLAGRSLTDNGFDRAFDRDITLRVLCFGPWCGGAQPDARVMAFLKREAGGYVMFADPCGSNVYADPSEDTLRRVTQCFQGGRCAADNG